MVYGLKTKVEALDKAKWLRSRATYPILVFMRENAKENTSKAICDYFTSISLRITTPTATTHGKTHWQKH
jgi:hypothetical protein